MVEWVACSQMLNTINLLAVLVPLLLSFGFGVDLCSQSHSLLRDPFCFFP